jgi:hypothetical protein
MSDIQTQPQAQPQLPDSAQPSAEVGSSLSASEQRAIYCGEGFIYRLADPAYRRIVVQDFNRAQRRSKRKGWMKKVLSPAVSFAEWVEEAHPRGPDGRFISKGNIDEQLQAQGAKMGIDAQTIQQVLQHVQSSYNLDQSVASAWHAAMGMLQQAQGGGGIGIPGAGGVGEAAKLPSTSDPQQLQKLIEGPPAPSTNDAIAQITQQLGDLNLSGVASKALITEAQNSLAAGEDPNQVMGKIIAKANAQKPLPVEEPGGDVEEPIDNSGGTYTASDGTQLQVSKLITDPLGEDSPRHTVHIGKYFVGTIERVDSDDTVGGMGWTSHDANNNVIQENDSQKAALEELNHYWEASGKKAQAAAESGAPLEDDEEPGPGPGAGAAVGGIAPDLAATEGGEAPPEKPSGPSIKNPPEVPGGGPQSQAGKYNANKKLQAKLQAHMTAIGLDGHPQIESWATQQIKAGKDPAITLYTAQQMAQTHMQEQGAPGLVGGGVVAPAPAAAPAPGVEPLPPGASDVDGGGGGAGEDLEGVGTPGENLGGGISGQSVTSPGQTGYNNLGGPQSGSAAGPVGGAPLGGGGAVKIPIHLQAKPGSKTYDIQKMLAQGHSVKKVADQLGVSYQFAYGTHKKLKAGGVQFPGSPVPASMQPGVSPASKIPGMTVIPIGTTGQHEVKVGNAVAGWVAPTSNPQLASKFFSVHNGTGDISNHGTIQEAAHHLAMKTLGKQALPGNPNVTEEATPGGKLTIKLNGEKIGVVGENPIDGVWESSTALGSSSNHLNKEAAIQNLLNKAQSVPTPSQTKAATTPKAPPPQISSKPMPAPAPHPAALAVPAEFPQGKDALTSLTHVGKLGGYSGALKVADAQGNNYVMKRGTNAAHVVSEVVADNAYKALGFNVPESHLYNTSGGPVRLSQWVEGKDLGEFLKTESNPEVKNQVLDEVRKGFAADAVLGNWDVIGPKFDNIKVGADGKVWRIDNGGALSLKGIGTPKPQGAWGAYPTELWTMADKSLNPETAQIFGNLSHDQKMEMVRDVVAKRDQLLAAVHDHPDRQMIANRIDNAERMLRANDAMHLDGFSEDHRGRFAQHQMQLGAHGVYDLFPKQLKPGQGAGVSLKDPATGKTYDNFRTKAGMGPSTVSKVADYVKANGGDYSIISKWADAQGSSSWQARAKAMKYYFATQASQDPENDFYWGGGAADNKIGFADAKSSWDSLVEQHGEQRLHNTIAAFHAFHHEMFNRIQQGNYPDRKKHQARRDQV